MNKIALGLTAELIYKTDGVHFSNVHISVNYRNNKTDNWGTIDILPKSEKVIYTLFRDEEIIDEAIIEMLHRI